MITFGRGREEQIEKLKRKTSNVSSTFQSQLAKHIEEISFVIIHFPPTKPKTKLIHGICVYRQPLNILLKTSRTRTRA